MKSGAKADQGSHTQGAEGRFHGEGHGGGVLLLQLKCGATAAVGERHSVNVHCRNDHVLQGNAPRG